MKESRQEMPHKGEQQYLRTRIIQVLVWGTAFFFLIIGFSLDRHMLFEISVPEEQLWLERYRLQFAHLLDAESQQSRAEGDTLNAARLNVEAAELRAAVRLLRDERGDAELRAYGLILLVTAFAILWPVVLRTLYGRLLQEIIPPRWAAISYSIVLGLLTTVIAWMTAIL